MVDRFINRLAGLPFVAQLLGVTAIAFGKAGLLGIGTLGDGLFRIDVDSGLAALLGGDIGGDVRGLTTVPEPASATPTRERRSLRSSTHPRLRVVWAPSKPTAPLLRGRRCRGAWRSGPS